jgi:hypothetical protein
MVKTIIYKKYNIFMQFGRATLQRTVLKSSLSKVSVRVSSQQFQECHFRLLKGR